MSIFRKKCIFDNSFSFCLQNMDCRSTRTEKLYEITKWKKYKRFRFLSFPDFLYYNKELRDTNMIYRVYFLDTANFQ